jgi:serine/threonine protein kinase
MSPEQARGKPVDKRTDIWAFGCCLFEALTGKKAFDGQTVTDVLAAVVKSEPSWDALPRETTWRLRELLSWCFRKEQRSRLREISVAGVYLEAALDEPTRHAVHETARRSASAWSAIVATAMAASLVTWMATSKARNPSPRSVSGLLAMFGPLWLLQAKQQAQGCRGGVSAVVLTCDDVVDLKSEQIEWLSYVTILTDIVGALPYTVDE